MNGERLVPLTPASGPPSFSVSATATASAPAPAAEATSFRSSPANQDSLPAAHPTSTPHEHLHDASLDGRRDSTSSRSTELASATAIVRMRLRHFPDFPVAGIDFVDILPIFADPVAHHALLRALELLVLAVHTAVPPVVVVGLDARGFLFGPALALRLRAAFVPVRKQGKLPGPCVTVVYEKEYGSDRFQMQRDAIAPGQPVLIVDDIIATGGSASAAADLVRQLGGVVVGFLFILEIPGLNGRAKLDPPCVNILLDT